MFGLSIADCGLSIASFGVRRLAGAFARPRLTSVANHFTWLSAPGLAALSVLHLRGESAAIFLRARGWRDSEKPRHVWLKTARGDALDEVMVAREDGGLTVTCHGGPAVRAAFEAELREAGFAALDAASLPLFGATTRYKREILRLLTQAQSDEGVRYCLWALEHGEQALAAWLSRGDPSAAPTKDLLTRSESTRYFFEPFCVHLWGPVNAGKSSLLNALCGEHLAAVGDEPGLTRDVIEGRFEHEGFTIRVFDTPGELAGGSELERRAFAQAREQRGDCVLYLVPPGGAPPADPSLLVVHSRSDELAPGHEAPPWAVSVRDEASLARLKSALVEMQRPGVSPQAGNAFALGAELRRDLEALAEGAFGADEIRRKWL
jgi:hypothetical protein